MRYLKRFNEGHHMKITDWGYTLVDDEFSELELFVKKYIGDDIPFDKNNYQILSFNRCLPNCKIFTYDPTYDMFRGQYGSDSFSLSYGIENGFYILSVKRLSDGKIFKKEV